MSSAAVVNNSTTTKSRRFWQFSLFDILTLLCAAAVPIAIVIYTTIVTNQQKQAEKLATEEGQHLANERREFDLKQAAELCQQHVYDEFLSDMYVLHRDGELNDSVKPWAFANARYRAAHIQWDPKFKGYALLFLKQRDLIGRRRCSNSNLTDVIELNQLNFDNVHLESGVGNISLLNMKCIRFNQVSMVNASFSFVDLQGSTFNGSSLKGAQFRGSLLTNVDFDHTQLNNVDFTSSDVTGTSFQNVDLTNTRFTEQQWLQVSIGENVIMPFNMTEVTTSTISLASSTTDIIKTQTPTTALDLSPIYTSMLPLTSHLLRTSTTPVLSTDTTTITTREELNGTLTSTAVTIPKTTTITTIILQTSHTATKPVFGTETTMTNTRQESSERLTSTTVTIPTTIITTAAVKLLWEETDDTLANIPPLNEPFVVAIDNFDDTLYIVDFRNKAVVKYDQKTGTVTRPFNTRPDEPRYVYVNQKTRKVYIGGISGSVLEFAPDGSGRKIVAGGNGKGLGLHQLGYISGLAMDPNENLYITDNDASRIMKWSANAKSGEIVVGNANGLAGRDSTHLSRPQAIYLDSANDMLYVADHDNQRVQRYHPIGNKTGQTVAGNGVQGISLFQLSYPASLSVDTSTNRLYVGEVENDRIVVWNLADYVKGGTCIIGCRAPIKFNRLHDFKFDSHGNLFIIAADDNRIRKFIPST